jgi:EAL domain-containing protein (putative c-di-GMP-specific phosphodiesterase class I)
MKPHTALRAGGGSLHTLLARDQVRSVYQPIVDLDSGRTVAFEALARGPEDSPLESPAALFGAAAEAGLTGELDRACRRAAVRGALAAGLSPPQSLFINLEPSTVGVTVPPLAHAAEIAAGQLRVIVEFTERALTSRPAEVLAAVAWLRERGCGIALDDVGIDERSLALMPLIAPDVIKLDMQLVQQRGTSLEAARVLNAVAAEAERSGATLLAEGIETEEQLVRARAVGATLGQGWRFGHPAALPGSRLPATAPVALRRVEAASAGTPYELIADQRRVRRGDKRLLLALSLQLEAEARALGGEAVVLATFQDASFFTRASSRRYEGMARGAALVGALGVGMPAAPAPGVRGASLEAGETLQGEWDVVVISPHFAGAFVARDLGDTGADADRRFEFFVTYDRTLVARAARALVARLLPSST